MFHLSVLAAMWLSLEQGAVCSGSRSSSDYKRNGKEESHRLAATEAILLYMRSWKVEG